MGQGHQETEPGYFILVLCGISCLPSTLSLSISVVPCLSVPQSHTVFPVDRETLDLKRWREEIEETRKETKVRHRRIKSRCEETHRAFRRYEEAFTIRDLPWFGHVSNRERVIAVIVITS